MQFKFLLGNIISIYMFMIFVRAILTWFVPYPSNQLHHWLIQVTEPVQAPVRNFLRRLLPTMRLDFSPYLVILVLNGLRNIIYYGF